MQSRLSQMAFDSAPRLIFKMACGSAGADVDLHGKALMRVKKLKSFEILRFHAGWLRAHRYDITE